MRPLGTATLALDLGKKCTGYAVLEETQLVSHGWHTFTGMDEAQMFMEMKQMLEGIRFNTIMHASLAPRRVVFEAAEHQQGKAREAYFALSMAVRVFAREHGIPVYKVYTGTMKKIATGDGHASKEDTVAAIDKLYELELSQTFGDDIAHNVADAIAVGITAWQLDAMGKLDAA